MKNKPLLSIEEKRIWLAKIFRDETGEFTQADKFKALVEDTKLASLEEVATQEEIPQQDPLLDLLKALPPAELPIQPCTG